MSKSCIKEVCLGSEYGFNFIGYINSKVNVNRVHAINSRGKEYAVDGCLSLDYLKGLIIGEIWENDAVN